MSSWVTQIAERMSLDGRSKEEFVEDFIRVYPDGVVYDAEGNTHEATEEDVKNFINHQKVYRFVGQFVAGKKVVDLGCGSGHGVALLKDCGAAYVAGCDLSEHSIEYARKKYGDKGDFSIQGVTSLTGYEDDTFDIAVSSEVLEHVKEFGLEKRTIREMKRVTRNGGLLYFGTPNTEIIFNHGFSYKEIRKLMKRNFKEFVIFENALVPFADKEADWQERIAKGETGAVVSENINLEQTVLPVGLEPVLKQGLPVGIYRLGDYEVDTSLLHNTHSWAILAVNRKGFFGR